MDKAKISFLKKEKNILINEYRKVPPEDKAKILVKIINIDERLDDMEKEPQKKQQE